MCTYWPAGYDWNALGITEYQLYPCVIGYYCLPNALNDLTNTPANYVSKNKCPLGTYGAKTKLTDKTGWTTCPAGYYCDPSISSTTPTVCTGGNNCPEGSDIQITCIGGDYWNTGNNFQQTICPVNYYCYPGVENQVRCPAGVICPVGSLTGNKWGKGFEVQQVSGVDTCIAWAKGYYNTDAATNNYKNKNKVKNKFTSITHLMNNCAIQISITPFVLIISQTYNLYLYLFSQIINLNNVI